VTQFSCFRPIRGIGKAWYFKFGVQINRSKISEIGDNILEMVRIENIQQQQTSSNKKLKPV